MRILIVAQNYAPEPTSVGPFVTGLAEHLAKGGNEVVVATTFPHYPEWKWQDGTRRVHRTERINTVLVRRFRVILPRRPSSTLWRVLFDVSMGVGMLLNCLPLKRAEVIICISPPLETALVGLLMGRVWRRPFIIQAQDLPVQAGLDVGMLRPGLMVRIALAFEAFMYRHAARVVVISDQFERQITKLVSSAHVRYIPNWVDTATIKPEVPSQSMRTQFGARNADFLVLHAGNMGEKQSFENVLFVSGQSSSKSKTRFALVGGGPQANGLRSRIISGGLDNVQIMPLVPPTRVSTMLASADALLISQKANVVDSVLPSKLLSYMASGRPVIAAVSEHSGAAKLVASAECGLVIRPEDGGALAAAIETLWGDRPLQRRFGANGRRYVVQHFSQESILKRWSELVMEHAVEA